MRACLSPSRTELRPGQRCRCAHRPPCLPPAPVTCTGRCLPAFPERSAGGLLPEPKPSWSSWRPGARPVRPLWPGRSPSTWPPLGQHHVARLQITMNYARPVRLFQAFANFDPVLEQLVRSKRSLPQPIGQCLAFKVFHHKIVGPALVADIIERADVGMVQGRNGTSFALETPFGLGVVRQVRRKNLDRHRTI